MRSAPAGTTWRHWAALVMLGLPVVMMATDFTALFLALPAVSADLAPSSTQSLWLVHIGELVAAGTLVTMGWLTGRLGPRVLVLMALGLYGAASALAAYAPTVEVLLVARALIGVATAATTPAVFAMVRSMFTSAEHRGIAFAVVMGAFPVGGALGPPFTGALLEYFSWGSVFLVNVPVAVVALVGGLWLFPGGHERTTDRIDITSVVMSMAAVMLVVYGLQEIADRGVTATHAAAVGGGLVLGALFVRRQRRLTDPLLDLGLFAVRLLRRLAIAFLLIQVAFLTIDLVLVQHLQIVLGIPTGTLGLMLAAPGVAAIVATAVTPLLTRRFTPSAVMVAGIGTGLVGLGFILVALTVVPSPAAFTAALSIVAFGSSPPMVLGAQLMVTSVPMRKSGPAAALQDVSASLGAATGIGALGSLALGIFGRSLRSGAPEGLSPAHLDAATEGPGVAVAVADGIGGALGGDLHAVTEDAWAHGTTGSVVAALVVAAVLLVLVARGLRGVRLPAEDEPDGLPVAPPSERGDAPPPAAPAVRSPVATDDTGGD
ncbi:MFS transporter [Georgenia sp. Z1491]|uniref:MFS transporter n=1 Tax=Georgenia sp. Z1491 TaxID=3416707 RepID=UPI003CFB79CC